ncbi:UNVERIFIED_CONTAM: hypothetical protein HDU68_008847 [Siphonaria sp. JEL0065]|nr:hypothetical protein HDU68_008847 [Siphonaria sp. JEL0065]
MKYTAQEFSFGLFSLACFPTAYVLVYFQQEHPSWCFADTCIDAKRNMQPLIYSHLAVFYGLLGYSAIVFYASTKIRFLQRIFSKTVLPGSTISVGELIWTAMTIFGLLGLQVHAYNWWWNRRAEKWFKDKKEYEGLVVKSLFNASGDILAIMIGLVMLPVSKNSFLSTFLSLPYTSLQRIHIWLGRILFWYTLFHASTGIASLAMSKADILAKLFTIAANAVWGSSRYQYITGVVATVVLAFVTLTSLSYVRRKWYNTFYFTHFLVVVFIAFAYFHASNCIFFLIPGLCLYCVDGVLRLSTRFSNETVSGVHFEQFGYITVTISTTKAARAHPGQFMRVCFPGVSQAEFHPWSIVKATDKSVTFLFRPSTSAKEWSTKVANLLQTYKTNGHSSFTVIKSHLQGPFGKEIEIVSDARPQDVVVFYVGGTGVAASIQAIEHVLARNQTSSHQTKIYLFWSSRYPNLDTLSHLQSWILGQGNEKSGVTIELFESSPKYTQHDAVSLHSNVVRSHQRSNLKVLLSKHVKATEFGDILNVGLFICGPRSFTTDALKAVSAFSKENKGLRIRTEIESFEL